jgi:hypothetical protein
MLAFLAAGFAVLWLYALVLLCAVRGVCLWPCCKLLDASVTGSAQVTPGPHAGQR